MKEKKDTYRELEQMLTVFIFLDLALFIGYLIAAVSTVLVAKILLAVLSMVVSVYGLWVLFNTRELKTQRSLWITLSFAGILVCIVVSLICNFP